MRGILEDFKLAARFLRRRAGLAAAIIGMLSVGIGGTAAVFSLVDGLLLQPLPFVEPERLMAVPLTVPPSTYRPAGGDNPWWSYPKFELFSSTQRAFDVLALYAPRPMTLRGDEETERMSGELVNARYLRTLGIPPAAGRDFTDDEDRVGPTQLTAIIGDGLWKRRFGANPAVVGRSAEVDGRVVTIIGVLPPGFRGLTGQADLLLPLLAFGGNDLTDPGSHFLELVARRSRGISVEQAAREVQRLGVLVDSRFPTAWMPGQWGARAIPLDSMRGSGGIQTWVLTLLVGISLVLVIACTNIANLLLARGVARRGEIAVRLALGGSRPRVIRQLLAESLILSSVAAAIGLLIAWAATRTIATWAPSSIQRTTGRLAGLMAAQATTIGVNFHVALLCLGAAIACTLLFGVIPALSMTRSDLAHLVKTAGDRGGSSRSRRTRGLLVSVEIAVTITLAVASALLVRSAVTLTRVESGVNVDRLLTFRVAPPGSKYPRETLPSVYAALRQRIAAIPGVRDVGAIDCPPVAGNCNVSALTRGGSQEPGKPGLSIGTHFVTNDWARTTGVRVIRGRWFDESDRPGSPNSIVISETAARRYFANEDPIGKTAGVGMGGFNAGAIVIGVASDVHFSGLDSLLRPDVYLPIQQSPRGSMVFFVRTAVDPAAVVGAVRATVRAADSRIPIYDVRTMQSRVDEVTARSRFSAVLLSSFAGAGVLLAMLGVYSVTAYTVAQSTREVGIRSALGATPIDVLRLILFRGLRSVIVGGAAGLLLAALSTRGLAALLFGVSPLDPRAYIAAVIGVLVTAVAACLVPALRALRVNVAAALAEP